MMHFAFPNVEILNGKFIGCGRYIVAPDELGINYTLPASIIINRATVERAVSLLAYESGTNGEKVYEKKDRTDKKYVGESMHLAYFFALLNRSRTFKYSWKHDIWCTGSITIADGEHPVLQEVGHEEEFRLKLLAFLAKTNRDQLFIVPGGNIRPEHSILCEDYHARLISLPQFQESFAQELPAEKVILTVQPDQLDAVTRLFFEPGPNPYKGLDAFDEKDLGKFFGREQLVQSLWQKFVSLHQDSLTSQDHPRLLAILGPSGSGKSSLVRAGLIPLLKLQALPHCDNSKVLILKAGAHPLEGLARTFTRLFNAHHAEHAEQRESQQSAVSSTRFIEMLRRPNDSGEYDGLSKIATRCSDSSSSPLILVIDQCEEIYSQCQNEEERQQFIDNVLYAASAHTSPVSVVVTLRSDFLEQTQAAPDFNNAIVSHSVIVPVMNRTNLRQVIECPAQLAGYRFAPETIDLLIAETEGYMGALPLLEFTLTLLWEGIVRGIKPETTLTLIGGIGGALADRAEKLYNTLEKSERKTARKIFIDLICLGEESRYTRKRLSLSEIIAYRENSEQVQMILQTFADAHTRLVTLDVDAEGNPTAEITHETLITRWQRLRHWLEVDREFHTWRQDLGAAIRQWESKDYDEGALMRGVLLAEAEEWLKKRPHDLGRSEREYILKSRAHFLREEERWKALYEKEQISTLEAYHLSSRALFAAHDELGALLAGIKAGKIVRQLDISPELKREIIATLRDIVYGIFEYNRFEGHLSHVTSISFHPNNTLLASGSYNGVIKLWNISDGTEIANFKAHSDIIRKICFSPDGGMLASTGDDTVIKLWDASTGSELATLGGHRKSVYGLSFSPDGTLLASGGEDETIKLWNVSEFTEIATLYGHEERVFSLAFHPRGSILASGSGDTSVKLWSIAEYKEIRTLQGHQQSVHTLSFHPDGELLASGSSDTTIKLWSITDGKHVATLRGHAESVNSVAFHAGGTWLASGSGDKTVKLWNVHDRREVNTFQGHDDEVLDVGFSPDGKLLASGSWDKRIKLWNVKRARTSVLKGRSINCVDFHPVNPWLVSGNSHKTIDLWDLEDGRKMITFSGHREAIQSVAVSPDGKRIASGSSDNTVKLWNISDGQEITTLSGHGDAVLSVAFSSDGTMLASGSSDHTIKLWDVAYGKELFTLCGHTDSVWNVAFHPDGKILASGAWREDNSIKIWDLQHGHEIRTLSVPDWPPAKSGIRLAFHPEGAMLASGSNGNGEILLWDVQTFQVLKTLHGHSQTILSLHFHPDGKMLASGSEDNTIKLWDVASGQELTSLQEHSNDVQHVRFRPDGEILASASLDNTIRLWNIAEQCDFDLAGLIARGCQWLQNYLKNNPKVSTEDRGLCVDSSRFDG